MSELQAPRSRSLLIGITSVVFFLLCMSCTTFLTWQFASYAANGYQLPGTGFPVNTNYTNNYFQGNYDPLNFAIFKWNPTGPIIVQLWPDVVIFTAFMLVVFLFGFAARLYPAFSAALNKQIKFPKFGSVSTGTMLLFFWTASLFGTWAYYWSVLYCDRDCMSDSSKSRFQCCRMFQETRKCTLEMEDPKYGCGTKEQQANAGISFLFLFFCVRHCDPVLPRSQRFMVSLPPISLTVPARVYAFLIMEKPCFLWRIGSCMWQLAPLVIAPISSCRFSCTPSASSQLLRTFTACTFHAS
jgi:hypothetical protein